MSHEPTSDNPTNAGHSAAQGPARATAAGGGFEPADLCKRYPHLQPGGLHAKLAPIPLHRPITMIGSRRTARIHLNSAAVSRAHALIVVTPTKVYACDLHTREGTRIKGHPIREMELREGDALQIGPFTFTFHDPRPAIKAPAASTDLLALQIQSPAGKQRVALEKRVTLIGRRNGSDVHLPFRDVSTANTAIVRLEGFAGESDSMAFVGYAVFDLGGKGTQVNGRPVHKHRLEAGDVLGIGPAQLKVMSLLQEIREEKPAPARDEAGAVDTPARAVPRAAPVAAVAEPAEVGADDLDEIQLDEDLTEEGVEQDVLGGSHVMPALAEPQTVVDEHSETSARAFAELLESGGADTASLDLALAAEPEPSMEAPQAAGDEPSFPTRGWRSTETDEPAAAEAPNVSEEHASAEPVDEEAIEDLEAAEFVPEMAHEALEDELAASDVQPGVLQEAAELEHHEPEPVDDAALEAPVAEEPADPIPTAQEHYDAPQDEPVEVIAGAHEYDAAQEEEALEWLTAEQPPAAVNDASVVEEAPDASEAVSEMPAEAREDEALEDTPQIDLSQLDFDAPEADGEPAVTAASEVEMEWEEETAEPAGNVAAPADDAPAPELGPGQEERAIGLEAEAIAADDDYPWDTQAQAPGGQESPQVLDEEIEAAPMSALDEDELAEPLLDERALPAEEQEEPARPAPLFAAFAPGDQDEALAEIPDQPDESAWVDLELSEDGAAPPPADDAVLEATQPTPESALDFSALDQDEAPAAAAPQADAPLSDSAFAMELEALAEEEAGDLVETSAAAQDSREQPPPEPQAPPEADAPGGTQAPAQPGRDWRSHWAVGQTAFLGNLTPLDSSMSLPMGAPRSPRLAKLPKTPRSGAAPPVNAFEQAPEGLGDDYVPARDPAGTGHEDRDQSSSAAPSTPSEPAGPPRDQSDEEFDIADPQAPPAKRSKAPRPKTIGFGGPVADVHHAVAPGASSPFSSALVGGGTGGVLDPSAVMPETSGLVDFVDAMNPPASGAREPLLPEVAHHGFEALDDPALATAPAAPAAPASQVADELAGKRPAPVIGADILDDDLSAEDELSRMDEFVRTIRGGVRPASGAPIARHSTNGQNGEVLDYSAADERSAPGSLPRDAEPAEALSLRQRATAMGRVPAVAAVAAGATHADGAPAESASPRRRLLWLLPLLFALSFVAAIAAVAGIWYGMQPTAPVTMKLRYDIPPALPEGAQIEYRQEQLNRLLEDRVRLGAIDALGRMAPGVDPGYLADVNAYNEFALRAIWSDQEQDTMVMSRSVRAAQRSAESARLKAIATALYDQGGTERAAQQRFAGEAQQLEGEIDKLNRQSEDLGRQVEEAIASLPPEERQSAAGEAQLAERIGQLDEQWTSAGRRVAQIREQIAALEDGDVLARDQRLADLKRRLGDIEAQIASSPDKAEAKATGPADDGLGEPEATPAAGALPQPTEAGSTSASQPGAAVEERSDPEDPRQLRGEMEARIETLTSQAGAAAAKLDAEAAAALRTHAAGFAAETQRLLAETLPKHLMIGGEVELLRQSLAKVRRQRSIELLDSDEKVRTLRAEVALKERELGAAVSDGLTERASGLRMALRLARDRLSMRVDVITGELENDSKVAEARRAYESRFQEARATLTDQREAFEQSLRAEREAIEQLVTGADAAALRRAMAAVESAARALVRYEAQRLPLVIEVWADRPAPPAAQPAAAEDEELSRTALDGAEPLRVMFQAGVQGEPRQQAATQTSLEAQAAELRKQIAQREQELREEQSSKLTQLRQQLAAADAAAAKAQREAQQARAQLGEMKAGAESAGRDRQRVAQLRVDRLDLESEIADKRRDLERVRASASVLATPRPPADADLEAPVAAADQRPRLIVIALAGIAALTFIGLFFTLRSVTRS